MGLTRFCSLPSRSGLFPCGRRRSASTFSNGWKKIFEKMQRSMILHDTWEYCDVQPLPMNGRAVPVCAGWALAAAACGAEVMGAGLACGSWVPLRAASRTGSGAWWLGARGGRCQQGRVLPRALSGLRCQFPVSPDTSGNMGWSGRGQEDTLRPVTRVAEHGGCLGNRTEPRGRLAGGP